MTTQVLKFVELPDRELKKVRALPKVRKQDKLEFRVVRRRGSATMAIPTEAADLLYQVLERLIKGEKVAVLTEENEVSPNDAATILGMSRPLVVHRMELGDLPFRYVGKHRRAKMRDVLEFKRKLDEQQSALNELADETAKLMADGL